MRLNGTQLRIQVAFPTQHQPRVTGPIQLTIQSPTSGQRGLLATEGGFNGYGEVVFRDQAGSPKAARYCGACADGYYPESAGPTAGEPLLIRENGALVHRIKERGG